MTDGLAESDVLAAVQIYIAALVVAWGCALAFVMQWSLRTVIPVRRRR